MACHPERRMPFVAPARGSLSGKGRRRATATRRDFGVSPSAKASEDKTAGKPSEKAVRRSSEASGICMRGAKADIPAYREFGFAPSSLFS